MNIILIDSEIKSSDKTFCTFSQEELDSMVKINLITHKNKVYQLIINYQKHQVICPLKMENGNIVGVYLPAFKSPYRPYPCYVYLYGIALYLSSLSMRKSAKETGKKFGISKFSHSTISRVMHLLLGKAEQISQINVNSEEGSKEENIQNTKADCQINSDPISSKYEEERIKESESLPEKPGNFDTFNKDENSQDYTNKEILLKSLYQVLENPKAGVKLIYKYFIRYGTLLI